MIAALIMNAEVLTILWRLDFLAISKMHAIFCVNMAVSPNGIKVHLVVTTDGKPIEFILSQKGFKGLNLELVVDTHQMGPLLHLVGVDD